MANDTSTVPTGGPKGIPEEAGESSSNGSSRGILGSVQDVVRKYAGRRKKKRGRPRLDARPDSYEQDPEPEPIPEPVEDETLRDEFQASLVAILEATGNEIADYRYKVLVVRYGREIAKEASDTARLSDAEKKMIGSMAVRLWKKYVGLGFEYTDEMMLSLIVLKIALRNIEPHRLMVEATSTRPETIKPKAPENGTT